VLIRAQVKNELQHLAMNQGVTKRQKRGARQARRWLRELPLAPWASRRREDLFKVRGMLDEQIALLDVAVKESSREEREGSTADDAAGVGPVTSMAFRADDG